MGTSRVWIWESRYLSLGLSRAPTCSETMEISSTSLHFELPTKLFFPLRMTAGAQLYNGTCMEIRDHSHTVCSCSEWDTQRES